MTHSRGWTGFLFLGAFLILLGVNFSVSDGLGVRVGASYLRIGGDDGGNGFRFGVGVVMPF